MKSSIKFREATADDVLFLIDCVLHAEQVGDTSTTYQQIFKITLSEVVGLLQKIFEEECSEQEICAEQFIVIEHNQELIGGCSAWIEPDGLSSAHLKAQLLAHCLGNDKFGQHLSVLRLFNTCHIPRTPGTLQLESFYISPEFRGQQLLKELIDNQITIYKKKFPTCSIAEIQLTNSNLRALRAYQKCGFEQDAVSEINNEIIPYLGGSGKIRLSKKIDN